MAVQNKEPRLEEGRKTVLVVEDEVALRFLIAIELREEFDVAVIEAQNADEAIAALRSNGDIDAVFTDVRMPGSMDGLALIRLVKSEFPNVRVAMTSGNLLHHEQVPEVRLFVKPYDVDEVARHLISIADRGRPG